MENTKPLKICMISIPDLKFDRPETGRLMNAAANEIQRVVRDTTGIDCKVMVWNTDIKFLDANQIHSFIKQLKKIQKMSE